MSNFWTGFEKQAAASKDPDPQDIYNYAVNRHLQSFNTDATAKRKKFRARRTNEGGKDYMHIVEPGRKGFLGIGAKPDKVLARHLIVSNVGKGKPSDPAVVFKKAAASNPMKKAVAVIERSDSNDSRTYKRLVNRVKNRFPRATVEFFDAKEHRPLVSKLGIKEFPHTVLIRGNQILSSHPGSLDEETLADLLKQSEMG